ncbi:hypothetical protein Bbelb_291600 [Branchiostoma belcheri]|nr:hypothetical protein Bbelb_291600 [Branchiostoma belcheri]
MRTEPEGKDSRQRDQKGWREDFGIACWITRPTQLDIQPGEPVSGHIAPEVATGGPVSVYSDIFSLGRLIRDQRERKREGKTEGERRWLTFRDGRTAALQGVAGMQKPIGQELQVRHTPEAEKRSVHTYNSSLVIKVMDFGSACWEGNPCSFTSPVPVTYLSAPCQTYSDYINLYPQRYSVQGVCRR